MSEDDFDVLADGMRISQRDGTQHTMSYDLAAVTRRAGTCHLHQVGRRAQMTQLKDYPEAQIRQGADRDRTLRVDDLSPQTSHRLDNCHCARRKGGEGIMALRLHLSNETPLDRGLTKLIGAARVAS